MVLLRCCSSHCAEVAADAGRAGGGSGVVPLAAGEALLVASVDPSLVAPLAAVRVGPSESVIRLAVSSAPFGAVAVAVWPGGCCCFCGGGDGGGGGWQAQSKRWTTHCACVVCG